MTTPQTTDELKQRRADIPHVYSELSQSDLLTSLQRLGSWQYMLIWFWTLYMTTPEHRPTIFALQMGRFIIKLLFHPNSQLFITDPGTSSVTAPNPRKLMSLDAAGAAGGAGAGGGGGGPAPRPGTSRNDPVTEVRQSPRDILAIVARLLTNDLVAGLMLYVDRENVHNPSFLGFYVNVLGAAMAFQNVYHSIANIVFHTALALYCLWAMGAPWQAVANCGVVLVLFGLYTAIILVGLRKSREQMHRSVDKKKLYLARIAHELRTPLTGVLGITTLLRAELGAGEDDDLMAASQPGSGGSAAPGMAVPLNPLYAATGNGYGGSGSGSGGSPYIGASGLLRSTGEGLSPKRVYRPIAGGTAVATPVVQELIESLTACTQSLLHIANDILDISKLEAAQLTLHSAPLDLCALGLELRRLALASALTLGRDVPARLTIEVDFRGLPASLQVVNADAQRIRQIAINLLNNAVKFTETGRILLAISVTQPHNTKAADHAATHSAAAAAAAASVAQHKRRVVPASADSDSQCEAPSPSGDNGDGSAADVPVAQRLWYRFQVSDSGCGFSSRERTTLFEPFSQGQHSVNGTGLGLYITKRLVDAFDGTIDAERNTEWGCGSVFTVDLPLELYSHAATAAAPQPMPSADGSPNRPSPQHLAFPEPRGMGVAPLPPSATVSAAGGGSVARFSFHSSRTLQPGYSPSGSPRSGTPGISPGPATRLLRTSLPQPSSQSSAYYAQAYGGPANRSPQHLPLTYASLPESAQSAGVFGAAALPLSLSRPTALSSPFSGYTTSAVAASAVASACNAHTRLTAAAAALSNGTGTAAAGPANGKPGLAAYRPRAANKAAAAANALSAAALADGLASSVGGGGGGGGYSPSARTRVLRAADPDAAMALSAAALPAASASASGAAAVPSLGAFPVSSPPILLVDDHHVNLQIIKKMVARLGYACDTASNGQEAVALAMQRFYPIILMDCQMPVLDGYEATRIIRSREDCPSRDTFVVALTAAALPGDQQKVLASGMNQHALKPIALGALRQIITKRLTQLREHPNANCNPNA